MAQKTLNEDLDIIQKSDLQITLLDGDLNIIQKLDDEPNDVGGLTAAELKAKFDEAGNTIKKYINETLVPELLAADAVEAQRAENEAARQAGEETRQEQEAARQEQEAQRQYGAQALALELQTGAAQLQADLTETVEALEKRVETREAALCLWEDYDPGQAYVPGNKAAFEGSSYVNIAPCTGVPPTGALPEEQAAGAEHWLLIAAKGKDGKGSLTPELGDERYLRLEGGIMTGPLTVQTPTAAGNPATKAYADARETAAKAYADGLKQEMDGSVFTRGQTLTAATAALYGLGAAAVPDDVLAKIRSLIAAVDSTANGKAVIYTGSYTGTGTEGSDSPNQISFPIAPKIVMIPGGLINIYPNSNYSTIMHIIVNMEDLTTDYVANAGFGVSIKGAGSSSTPYGKKSVDGKTLMWYVYESQVSSSGGNQFNTKNKVYRWIAFA